MDNVQSIWLPKTVTQRQSLLCSLKDRTPTPQTLLIFAVSDLCQSGSTPLHLAALFGSATSCAVLIDGGARTDLTNKVPSRRFPAFTVQAGITPLLAAALAGHSRVVTALVIGGADPSDSPSKVELKLESFKYSDIPAPPSCRR